MPPKQTSGNASKEPAKATAGASSSTVATQQRFCDHLTELNKDQEGLVTAINAYTEGRLTGEQLLFALSEDNRPEDLFKPSLLELPILFRYLKEWLERHEVCIKTHSSNRIISRLCMTIYSGIDQTTGINCINEYRKRGSIKNSILNIRQTIERESLARIAKEDNISKIAHNIAIRFKDKYDKFSGDIYENWKNYLSEYLNECSDYSVPIEKRVQFRYHVLKDDARSFYDEKIQGRVFNVGEACTLMDKEYNSYTRQVRIRNEVCHLRVSTMRTADGDEIEALQNIHSKITKLYMLGPSAYRTESHKIDYLRNAVTGTTWATAPLSRMSTTNMKYQELYARLESSIQHEKDTKQAIAVDHAAQMAPEAMKNLTIGEGFRTEGTPIPGVMFTGQARYGRHPNMKSRQCYNCASNGHLIKECPKRIDIPNMNTDSNRTDQQRASSQRNYRARRILFEVCQQIAQDDEDSEQESTMQPDPEQEDTSTEDGNLRQAANRLYFTAQNHFTTTVYNTNVEDDF